MEPVGHCGVCGSVRQMNVRVETVAVMIVLVALFSPRVAGETAEGS